MFKSRRALVLFTGLALLAGSSTLLADPGKGKGKSGFSQLPPMQQDGRGGHARPAGAPQGQWPQNVDRQPGGQPARGNQGGGAQWGGVEQGRHKGRGEGWTGGALPGADPQHGNRQWPGGKDSRGVRDDGADWGGSGIDQRIRGVLGENRGYWGAGQSLPPGIRKNLQRGKPLPPGIARQRLDSRLESRLPRFPGFEWARVGSDLVQLSTSTGVVNQVLSNAFD